MIRRVLIPVIALLGSLAAFAMLRGNAEPSGVAAYLPEKPGDVRVLVFGEKPEELTEGLYDWADYLNDFAAEFDDVEVTFEPQGLCRELIDHKDCGQRFATLFLNRNGEAFFYGYPVQEPQIYIHARLALKHSDVPEDIAAYTIEPVQPK